MEYYFPTGPRADLAAIEVNPPEGYIGSKIIPTVNVAEKTGVVYYATVTADVAAQTGRSAGAAPTGTQISDSNTTFTAAEVIKRGSVTPDEAKTMGGIAQAEMAATKFAKRSVMAKLETDICAEILGGSPVGQFDAAKLLEQSQTASDALRQYEGRYTLISSTMTLKRMVQQILGDTKLAPVFARTISGTSNVSAVAGLNFEAWKNALAMFLGVDQVLAGDSSIWNATAVSGRYALAKLDDGMDALSHKWKPVLGKVFQFGPDISNPWYVETIGDRLTKNNHADAATWYDVVILNSGAVKLYDGVA